MPTRPTIDPQPVLVVGAGLVGTAIAWLLQRSGHRVTLIDPCLDGPPPPQAGSWAALGVLMAQVFHRSSGRGWRLRQRSHQLWRDWIAELSAAGHRLPRREGLLLLAAEAAEWDYQQRLAAERQARGLPLELWSPLQLTALQPQLPAAALGGLHSPGDGQLDPGPLIRALLLDARRHGLATRASAAVRLERGRLVPGGRQPWRLHCRDGQQLETPWLVLAAGLASGELLAGVGLELPLEPVLGQALELELPEAPAWSWPGAVVWRGINLVPRPDLASGRRLWLGATLEPGDQADPAALETLRHWAGAGLGWLERAEVVRHWQGLRCRPSGQAAPVLEQPEPGLLIASGHYRNGVLLAPASAAWVREQIEAGGPAGQENPGLQAQT